MGYDMTLVERDHSRDDEHITAKADFNAACDERNALPDDRESPAYNAAQEKVTEAYNRMSSTDNNYFRLNIWGMGQMREDMDTLGMLDLNYEMKQWPEAEDFKVTEGEQELLWEIDTDDPEEFAKLPEHVQRYLKANDDVRAWSPATGDEDEGEGRGLPIHKFGSNDGWLVTPEDCKSALALYEKAKAERPEDVEKVRLRWSGEDATEVKDGNYFDEWIDWLKRAVDHGGFRVY